MHVRPVLLAAALGTALAAPTVPAEAATSTAGTQLAATQYAYPHPLAPDCNEGSGPGVCRRDVYGFWQGQCTSWVAHRLNTVNGVAFVQNKYKGIHWGNAGTWGATARANGFRVDSRPAPGAVAWYQRNPGHVAYVEKVNPDGSLLLSEMNFDNHNAFRLVTVTKSYRWPTGFIHVKDLPGTAVTWSSPLAGSTPTNLSRRKPVAGASAGRAPLRVG